MFYYILGLIIFISLFLILYIVIYNSFQNEILKLKEVEMEIDESLRTKYDIICSIVESLKKESKAKGLKEIENLKNENFSSFEFSRELKDIENKIINLKNEIKKLQKDDDFKIQLSNINQINLKINSEIRYYNDVTSRYTKMKNKFPSNIISKISKFENRNYFDNKNLNDEIEKDFKA